MDSHCDLSVVVVFFNMRREATRTLHSLSRAYQRAVDDLDYEVIVVENGSDEDQRLGADLVRSFGPEFRYIDMGAEATPSPVPALNHGITCARGDVVALMIDGAHVVTPGLLHFGMAGIAAYEPAVVCTQAWHIGPGQQHEMVLSGYDQTYEDKLFAGIDWPSDGYRLFEIGHLVGERDWFDGMWESNCLFVPTRVLRELGGFDERFDMPGGGAANVELYARLISAPDLNVVTILGEASFHQVHGGTTTNQTEIQERRDRIISFIEHYREVSDGARVFPSKPVHYVGSLPPEGGPLRTRARRGAAKPFRDATDPDGGIPSTPVPIPQDQRRDLIEAFWWTLAWRETSWLGIPVQKAPTDLFLYQEIVTRVRPEFIIEFPTGTGGRALFFASICDWLGHGHVVSIGPDSAPDIPEHDRIHYVIGAPAGERTLANVRQVVGEEANALVIVGSRGSRQRTIREFNAYAPFVAVGSYAVIEDTIVNGHPVWPEFGPGPWEGVNRILGKNKDFVPDLTCERYGLTFNPGGFLRRVR